MSKLSIVPRTITAVASADIGEGIAVAWTSSYVGSRVSIATSGTIVGITTTSVKSGQVVTISPLGERALAQIAAAVTDPTVGLKATTGGQLTPVTTSADVIVAMPCDLASSANSIIEVTVWYAIKP